MSSSKAGFQKASPKDGKSACLVVGRESCDLVRRSCEEALNRFRVNRSIAIVIICDNTVDDLSTVIESLSLWKVETFEGGRIAYVSRHELLAVVEKIDPDTAQQIRKRRDVPEVVIGFGAASVR